ncbi:MAG TPA: DNA-3-methyladenine glycosylase [Tepidisphaeraceae bacterium]|jgi:DNA-3-methyladenine glycosylase II|nr:DNA-3-methyladenine glycosylase [Tepidisphaeraceae bacterium]
MWFDAPAKPTPWDAAIKHLIKADPVLGEVIRRVGPCTIAPRRDYFVALCKAIFSQQLSTVVAATLFGRFGKLFPGQRPTPALLLEIFAKDPESLRGCGLSRQKAVYLKDLADHFVSSKIPTRKLATMTDEQVIEALVAVKGVGRWTAEMFLMFVLNRPDVLPVDDLGLREGVRDIFSLKQRPTPKEVIELGEKWRPYRSIATWYIWRRKGTGGIAPDAGAAAGEAPQKKRPAGRKKSARRAMR